MNYAQMGQYTRDLKNDYFIAKISTITVIPVTAQLEIGRDKLKQIQISRLTAKNMTWVIAISDINFFALQLTIELGQIMKSKRKNMIPVMRNIELLK